MTLPDIAPAPKLAEALADQIRQSASHARAALETLPFPSRAGYSTAQSYTAAGREHEERTRQLATLAADLDALAKHYEGQGKPARAQCPNESLFVRCRLDADHTGACDFGPETAEPAEEKQMLRVFYVCPRCSHAWEEETSCACDSECPQCECENIEAERWEDIDAAPEVGTEPAI